MVFVTYEEGLAKLGRERGHGLHPGPPALAYEHEQEEEMTSSPRVTPGRGQYESEYSVGVGASEVDGESNWLPSYYRSSSRDGREEVGYRVEGEMYRRV